MNDLNRSDVESVCRKLLRGLQGVLSWQWDGRFEAVLAEFGVGKKDGVRAILERDLNHVWDSSNIGYAPDIVRTINIRVGQLRSGQLLFTSDPSREALVFGAWWPWGDGQTISIRIAPSYKKISDSERTEKVELFKSWFGI